MRIVLNGHLLVWVMVRHKSPSTVSSFITFKSLKKTFESIIKRGTHQAQCRYPLQWWCWRRWRWCWWRWRAEDGGGGEDGGRPGESVAFQFLFSPLISLLLTAYLSVHLRLFQGMLFNLHALLCILCLGKIHLLHVLGFLCLWNHLFTVV